MSMLSGGVYTLSEAALYAGVHPATIRSWFKPRSDGGLPPLFVSDYAPIEEDYAISFLNLVEVHVAKFFKRAGVKSSIISTAYVRLKEALPEGLSTRYPFAHADLGTDGVRIIRKMGDSQLIDAIDRQHFIAQLVDLKLVFDPTTRLANAWKISEGVSINPLIGFGKPVVENSGVSTKIIARQYIANRKDADLVARLFRIEPAGVINAYNFEKGCRQVAA